MTPSFNKRNDKQERGDPYGFIEERDSLLRGIASGAIFGMPLLYTMDVWWRGMLLSEWKLLGILAAILIFNFFFSLYSGFRTRHGIAEAASEAISSVGIGILFSAFILWLIGEISLGKQTTGSIGKILLEAVAVSIGVIFANSQILDRSPEGDGVVAFVEGDSLNKEGKNNESPERKQMRADLVDIGAALAGAVVLASSIAPIEEVPMIAYQLDALNLFYLLVVEVVLCYIILFASGFEEHHVYVKESLLQSHWAETVITCGIALLVSFGMLVAVGFEGTMTSHSQAVASTVVLGLPAVVGGAAGRVVI